MFCSNRRQFLQSSVLLGTTFVVGGPLAAARAAGEKPGSKMQLGFCTYLWGQDWDLPTLIANCEKAEVLAVETRTEHAHGVEPTLNESQRGGPQTVRR